MVAECLHQRYHCHRRIIMILWTAHILLIQLANDRWKKGVKWKREHFLAFLLFYQTMLRSECEALILLSGSIISDNHTSAGSFTDRSEHHSTLSPQMNLYTAAAVSSNEDTDSMHIIRNNLGDTFYDDDQSWASCSADKCTRRSSGTATLAIEANINNDGKKLLLNRYSNNLCYCRCLQNLPTFREDMHVCVDDVLECSLATFVIGNREQRIPYVFLPLKGQIVYPNAEITFNGLRSTPTCIISRARYLTPSGWYDIQNHSISGTDQSSMPFKVFHDERRTFLQWLGNGELRANLEGRLLLIDLICKERDSQSIFTPCLSFRIAGVPSMKTILIENSFDESMNKNQNARFSSNEYIALGLATLLLAMIYIASVFLYLRLKKNKMKEKSSRRGNTFRKYINIEDNGSHLFGENQSKKLIVEEEGLIKNNPLLMKRYYPNSVIENAGVSPMDGNRLAEENTFCSLNSNIEKNSFTPEKPSDNLSKHQSKVVSAMVHPRATNIAPPNVKRFENPDPQRWQMFANKSLNPFSPHFMQKNENIDLFHRKEMCERQQQSDTNNIEEKHPDENISIVECPEDVIPTNSRHKLYFNPAYFEPELLMAPPPAAVEFLTKIREVMTIAKRKMSMKKFLPSLTQIPEEHQSYDESRCSLENDSKYHAQSNKSEKSNENTKQNAFVQTENSDFRSNEDKEKRQIIQKWLQSIPHIPQDACNQMFKNKNNFNEESERKSYQENDNLSNGTFAETGTNDKSHSVNSEINALPDKTNRNQSQLYENAFMERISKDSPPTIPKRESPEQCKPKVPLRKKSANTNKNHSTGRVFEAVQKLDNREDSRMNNSFDDFNCGDPISLNANIANGNNFSSSLPLDEELTMHNAIYNVVTGSTTLSKLKARYDTKDTTTSAPFTDDTFNSRHNLDGKYSLVSEVYVNDGYNSSEASLSSFNSSGEGENTPKKVSSLSRKDIESSRLMIQLNDCPFFYSVENADDFEPDTLDRKPSKENEDNMSSNQMNFVDSLERPAISLRTYGSFRQDSSQRFGTSSSNLKRTFGSLQEIYEARRKSELENNRSPCDFDDDSPRSLTTQLENTLWRRDKCTSRHRYRQRKQSSPPPLPPIGSSLPYIPPKLAKPPLPPKRSEITTFSEFPKPDISSNFKANSCSILDKAGLHSNNFAVESKLNVCFNNNVWTYRPEDSGYLSSSDSDKSKIFPERKNPLHHCGVAAVNSIKQGNEDDEDDDGDDDDNDSLSCCNDGNSESGAESIETNFKFYKNRGVDR